MKSKKHSSSKKRSLAKSFTFRVLIIFTDGIIGFALTHRYDLTVGFVIFTNIASTIIYFLHERVWSRTRWGIS